MNKDHLHVLLIAGGSGTRLYPRSRASLPKQFQKTVGDRTLFEQTLSRMNKLAHPENIYVSTNDQFVPLIKAQGSSVPPQNILTEPLRKNTAAPIILAAAIIAKKDPEALIVSLWSDSLVLQPNNLLDSMKVGIEAVQKNPEFTLIVACRPTSPHTGYGYIEGGELFGKANGKDIFVANGFKEKPDRETAIAYLRKGNYFWNSGGHFIWKAKLILEMAKKYIPEIYSGVEKIMESYGAKDYEKVKLAEFSKFPDLAIEPALLENLKDLLVIPDDLGWSDVGSWETIVELVDQKLRDSDGNYAEGLHVGIDTHNTNVFGHDDQKLIATIGLDNVTIVTTEDAILIMEHGRGQEVKKIVDEIKKRKLDHLL